MPDLSAMDRFEADQLVAKIAVAPVMTLDERVLQLREVWGDQPTMTCFLRHFGCLFCHQMVHDAVQAVPDVIARGAQAVLVGNGSVEEARRFFSGKGLPQSGCRVVTDPERESYRAAELERGYRRTFLNRGAQRAYVKARRSGHRIVGLFGDLTQLGGVLVTKPPLHLVYLHRSEFAGDHPEMTAVMAAVDEATGATREIEESVRPSSADASTATAPDAGERSRRALP